jgi:hypothetical protein
MKSRSPTHPRARQGDPSHGHGPSLRLAELVKPRHRVTESRTIFKPFLDSVCFRLPDLAAATGRATSGRSSNTKMSWHAGTTFDASIDPNQPLNGGSVQSPHQPLSAISPTLQHYPSSSRQGSILGDGPARKRKRSYTGDDGVENSGEDGLMQDSPSSMSKGKHQPGVKRACNDCRQQKVDDDLEIRKNECFGLTCRSASMQCSGRWAWRLQTMLALHQAQAALFYRQRFQTTWETRST